MEITLRVDLNTGKLYAWNANGTMLAVFKGQDTPDFSTLDQYIGYNAGIVYLPECDFGFRYYDFVSKKYYGARGGANTPITIFNKRQSLRPQIDSEGLFTVDNWTGGTLNFECYQFPNALLTVNPDEMRIPEATPYLADQIHLIGDFCGWMFLDEYTVLPDASDPYIFHCTLPAGTSEFKITEDTEWAVQFGKIPGTAQKNADGSITMHILNDSDTDNFQFTSPITEAISFTVDLRTMTVTFPAGSPIAVDEAKDYTGVMVARLDDGFFEPWAGASEAVMQNYDAIAWPQPDGSYQFNFFVPRKQFRVRFISELAPKGSPNKLIVPGSDDRELASDTEGNAYSRAIVTTDQNAGYWTIKNWKGGDISVTVTPGENPTVKFSTQSEADGGWYLVGTPTDWIAPSEANAEFYSNWQLTPCYEGMYGEFEIPAAPEFRFFKKLAGWHADYSVGSDYMDFYTKTCELGETFTDTYYDEGLGNWAFPDWEGGLMHILINTIDNTITLSKNPIEHGVIPDESLWIYIDGKLERMEQVADGVFTHAATSTDDLKIFTRKLPISPDEPEWACSYVLSAPEADYRPEYDRFNVAEMKYTVNDGISTAAPNPILLDFHESGITLPYNITVDTNTKTLYIERNPHFNIYVSGSFNEDRLPTLTTRNEFADYYYDESKEGGLFLNLPSGKNEIIFDIQGLGWNKPSLNIDKTADIDLSDGFEYGGTLDLNYGFGMSRNVINNWKGGYLYVDLSRFLDFDTVDEINWACGNTISKLTPNDSKPLTYSGTVIASPESRSHGCYIPNPEYDPYNYDPTIPSEKLYFGCNQGYSVLGYYYTPDTRYYFDGNDLSIPLGFSGHNFLLPQLAIDEREISVTVDLLAKTISMTLIGDPVDNVPAISSSNPDLESTMDPSRLEPEVFTASLSNVGAGENSFNILDGDGNVIVPASGNTNIEFDQDGTYTGNYEIMNPAPGKSARAASRTATQWTFNNPKAGDIAIAFNKTKKSMTIYSESANENYFMLVFDGLGSLDDPYIENLEEMKSSTLVNQRDDMYSGKLTGLQSDGSIVVITRSPFSNMYRNNVGPRVTSGSFNIGSGETATFSTDYPGGGAYWEIMGADPDAEINVTYDARNMEIFFSRNSTGTDEIFGYSDELRVNAGRGRIVIDSPTDAELAIHNLQGLAVKSISVKAGRTSVNIAPGFYIVAGKKLLVR